MSVMSVPSSRASLSSRSSIPSLIHPFTKLLVVGLLAAGILAAPTKTSASDRPLAKGEVVELVAYTIKEDHLERFPQIRARMLEPLRELPGYRLGQTFRSVHDPRAFVDYFVWASLDDAKSAAQTMVGMESSQPFLEAIETIRVSDHSILIADGEMVGPGATAKAPGDVYELVVYSISPEAVEETRGPVFELVLQREGFFFARSTRSVADDSLITDFLRWSNREAADAAFAAVNADPAGAAMNAAITGMRYADRLELFATDGE